MYAGGDGPFSLQIYRVLNEEYRALTLQNAAKVVESQSMPLNSIEVIRSVGLGEKTAEKVWEIVQTGSLRRLDELKSDERTRTLLLFSRVINVGASHAARLYARGHRTLTDLLRDVSLDPRQRLGVQLYDELRAPIPRAETSAIAAIVRSAVREIDPRLQLMVCGSYRRGKATSGDIDIVLWYPAVTTGATDDAIGDHSDSATPVLLRIVQHLHARQLLTHDLMLPSSTGGIVADLTSTTIQPRARGAGLTRGVRAGRHEGSARRGTLYEGHPVQVYMGICRLSSCPEGSAAAMSGPSGAGTAAAQSRFAYSPNRGIYEVADAAPPPAVPSSNAAGGVLPHRRLDLRLYHVSELPFALIHWTGALVFNRALRAYAMLRRSMNLSEHALVPIRIQGNQKVRQVDSGTCTHVLWPR